MKKQKRKQWVDTSSTNREELEAAADILAEVETQFKAEELLSTEEREEHDKAILEEIMNRQGVDGVISMLKDICNLKAKYLRTHKKDKLTAELYTSMASKLDDFIGWYYTGRE